MADTEYSEGECDICKDYEHTAFRGAGITLKPDETWHSPGMACSLGFEADFDLHEWPVEEFKQFVQKVKDGKPAVVRLKGVKNCNSWWPTTPAPISHTNGTIHYNVYEGDRVFDKSDEKVCQCLIKRLEHVVDIVDQALITLANQPQ
uniref:Uncharacterized protein n=1 Tax=Clandestinovirus TaxID=2831644 RepID=A0A8F8PNH7_9VIRU|nr:hypothetical protein KOM_12_564 [Clandestinovirus]